MSLNLVPGGALNLSSRSADDLAKTVHVLRRVFSASGYPSLWPEKPQAWLTPTRLTHAWVAKFNGEVIGHVCLVGPDPDPWPASLIAADPMSVRFVSRLFVDPLYQGHHVGGLLLSAAVARAREDGLSLMLDVVDDAESAIRAYEGLAWQRVGQRTAEWRQPSGRQPDLIYYAAPKCASP